MSYLFPYYEKAADMGWAEAEATVAYWRYMGFYCEQNKEEGERRFAALTSPEAILWGKHYRAFVEEFTGDKALLQIFFFFLKTGNIFKRNFAVVRHGQGCTAFAEIHHPGIASRRLTAAHRKKYHKDHADQKHRQYRRHKNALFFNCDPVWNLLLIQKLFCLCHIRNIKCQIFALFHVNSKFSCHSLRILSDLYAADLILCDIFLEL